MRASSTVLASALLASTAVADTATFEFIPGALSANDMSPDGRWVVGETGGGAYRLDTTTGAMLSLPGPGYSAVAVSDDGTVVLGSMPIMGSGQVAGIWRESTNEWTSLGHTGPCDSSYSSPYELSGDGTVAVGLAWEQCSGRGFVWTEATGMLQLEGLANGNNRASAVSADGTLVGGFAQGSFSRTPAIWDGVTLTGELLDPPDGDALGEVYGISDDGSVLLGSWNQLGMIVRDGAMELFDPLIPTWNAIAMDIADDSTVVGFEILMTTRRAWILLPGDDEVTELKAHIRSLGAEVPTGFWLQVAQAISADGRTIIGHGGFDGGWIVHIDAEECDGDVNGDGVVDVTDLLDVIGAWGDNPGHPADLDGDGIVGVSDLLLVLGGWGGC